MLEWREEKCGVGLRCFLVSTTCTMSLFPSPNRSLMKYHRIIGP
ncbi:hypothetical protein CKAH01_00923 [Colletotrichum kahawae]|uniref:Uncharacterized protein n=1 Tax=Colletotrichum kahawae TaxID=34407 RepID=A0AAD9YI48_COLKA|nr:hypothetical protein CKAH01_00923 [Colletotrichum kahawae]